MLNALVDMNWMKIVNTVSCLILLAYLLPLAAIAEKVRHKVTLVPLTGILLLQMLEPQAWIPLLSWPSTALTAALAYTVTIWRKELWRLVKYKFTGNGVRHDHYRRRADVMG